VAGWAEVRARTWYWASIIGHGICNFALGMLTHQAFSLGVKPQRGIDLRQDGVVPVGSGEIELSEHDLRERMLSVLGWRLLADRPHGGVIDGVRDGVELSCWRIRPRQLAALIETR
jgi:hypothetical protein